MMIMMSCTFTTRLTRESKSEQKCSLGYGQRNLIVVTLLIALG